MSRKNIVWFDDEPSRATLVRKHLKSDVFIHFAQTKEQLRFIISEIGTNNISLFLIDHDVPQPAGEPVYSGVNAIRDLVHDITGCGIPAIIISANNVGAENIYNELRKAELEHGYFANGRIVLLRPITNPAYLSSEIDRILNR